MCWPVDPQNQRHMPGEPLPHIEHGLHICVCVDDAVGDEMCGAESWQLDLGHIAAARMARSPGMLRMPADAEFLWIETKSTLHRSHSRVLHVVRVDEADKFACTLVDVANIANLHRLHCNWYVGGVCELRGQCDVCRRGCYQLTRKIVATGASVRRRVSRETEGSIAGRRFGKWR